jgi:hypothetical protein
LGKNTYEWVGVAQKDPAFYELELGTHSELRLRRYVNLFILTARLNIQKIIRWCYPSKFSLAGLYGINDPMAGMPTTVC